MKLQNVLLGVGAFGVGLFLWGKARASKIDIGQPSIPFQKATATGLELGVKLPVTNRSGFAVTLRGFVGRIVDADGSELAFVTMPRPVKVPAFGRVEVDFDTVITWTSLGAELLDIVKAAGKIDPKQYRIVGTLQMPGGVQVDVDTSLL